MNYLLSKDISQKKSPPKGIHYDYFSEQVDEEERKFIKTLTGMVNPLEEKPKCNEQDDKKEDDK